MLLEIWMLNFNSTMVRLKAGATREEILAAIFQFHYGTIKSILGSISVIAIEYFNSTMVRLKV